MRDFLSSNEKFFKNKIKLQKLKPKKMIEITFPRRERRANVKNNFKGKKGENQEKKKYFFK